ncbi:MAG: hypothetical protein R3E95_06135 [Thiolinea sp.]
MNAVCGAAGKQVQRNEFKALLRAHPAVLERVSRYTAGRVFADRPQPADLNAYLDDLTDAWFNLYGFYPCILR